MSDPARALEIVRIDPRTDPRYAHELELRYRVLRVPLGMPRESVTFAGEEERAIHVVAMEGPSAADNRNDMQLVGCVLFDFQSGRVRQMAVETARQKGGLGRQLMSAVEEEARRAGIREISLHAREVASGFYARLGYARVGEPFLEVGIPHFEMHKKI